MKSDDPVLFSTGQMQQVDCLSSAAFEKALEYATKSKTHMWISLVQYLHTDKSIREAFGSPEPLLMDKENLIGHHIGCYICEEQATTQLINRACKGQPRGELQYV